MAPGSRTSLINIRPMPVIDEDEVAAPAVPARSLRRSALGTHLDNPYYPPTSSSQGSRGSSRGSSHGSSHGSQGSGFLDKPGRKRETSQDVFGLKASEWFARRGGWYRLGLISFLLIGLAIGLGVGLTYALRGRSSDSDSGSDSGLGQAQGSSLFPAGQYSFTTALTSVMAACSSSPAYFGCYPFTAYTLSSANLSAATFQWSIKSRSRSRYTVSSSQNPFAPQFADLPMTLLDANLRTERFTFNFTMAKAVRPAAELAPGQQRAATCWYNTTVLKATLWTRTRAPYPAELASIPESVNASYTFSPWPYKIDISQIQAPGPGVPDCRDYSGVPITGADSAAVAGSSAGECACHYRNYDLGSRSSNNNGSTRTSTSTSTPAQFDMQG